MIAPEAVSDVAVIPPFTSKAFAGVAVPMPILPDEEINNRVVLLVSSTKLLASLVPKVAVVPKELPPCTNALVPVGAIKEAVRAFIAQLEVI